MGLSSQMRILLVSPRGSLYRHRGGIWKKSLRYAPLTLTTLAALIPPELDVTCTLVDEGIEDVDLNADADIVGISAITGTAPRAYELADHFRSRGIPVVLGGVHPTLVPDESARHADAVVTGYAEESWPQILRDFAAGHMAPRYDQSPDMSLAGIPHPRRDMIDANHYVIPHTIEATRGCVHQCEFCVVPTAWGSPLLRPVGDVVDDIRQMGARRLLFLDLNLIANVRYAKELFQALIPLNISWGGLATTAVAADDELLDLAVRSGCKGLLIGFETLSKGALAEVGKSFNMHKDYFEVVDRLHDRKIAIQGTFVFGFDSHDEDTFAETVDFAIDANIDLPRYAILTPFPSTPLYRRMQAEDRILTRDWALYDGQHVVYQPKQMSAETLQEMTGWAWQKTYSVRSIAKRMMGARIQLPLSVAANLGYRFYANNLHRYYTCDWNLPGQDASVLASEGTQ